MGKSLWKILDDGTAEGDWWHRDESDKRIVCDLCPRECHLKPGDKGFCFVRENKDDKMVLSTYGRSTGFCIDPIEKKPLNHFYPGTSVLSFGTAGCNLGCQFCQNWDISKSREVAKLSEYAAPETVARAAKELGCKSVAFTYNDPIVWAEYAIDTAIACREAGVQSVAVTAGYISEKARPRFFQYMDAANVDLKGFTEHFYSKITYSHLQPILDTLIYLKKETNVWFEITNLVIPNLNDDPSELQQMCEWIVEALGSDVPIHFSAFHPDFRMRDRPNTPIETLVVAYDIAIAAGLNYVYVGNVHDKQRQSTYCPQCKQILVERDWYQLGRYELDGDRCKNCKGSIAGRFGSEAGNWGSRRQPVPIHQFAHTSGLPQKPSDSTVTTTQAPDILPTPRNTTMLPASPAAIPVMQLDQLLPKDLQAIHRLASRLVAASVMGRTVPRILIQELGALASSQVMGVFVTLKRGKQLRGCCGMIGQPFGLVDALANSAQRTAKEDTRLPAISPSELPYLSLDVTLLGASEPMKGNGEDLFEQFEIGKHGLRIAFGDHAGLLLPSVPVEQGWNKTQFLEGLCRKAGLDPDAWRKESVRLERFVGLPIEGHIDPMDIGALEPQAKSIATPQQVGQLRSMVSHSILALTQGATPSYVDPSLPDGTVHGIVLSIFDTKSKRALAHLVRVSLRPGMPLQSTLFELSKTAANILVQSRPQQNVELEIGLTLLHDPALHGYLATGHSEHGSGNGIAPTYQLEGVNTKHRAILTMLGGARVAVAFDGSMSPEQLLDESAQALSARGRMVTVYSMEAISTQTRLIASTAPVGQAGPGVRSPAVAGHFYPADYEERCKLVAPLIADFDPNQRLPVLAIMTPHAGLQYSGKTAGDVWKRIQIPETILIIGPKHTADGVDWAVAPYRRWQLSPNREFNADQELAQKIADQVQGMQLDATAHQREHGIEVQLPFLEQLAPDVKIAAIAMAAGSWQDLLQAAKQLAQLLKSLDKRPLLVISSDMNHYATDPENRRLDRLALDAMKSNDPRKLLDACQEHQISMCGVIPAALVMQTLIELGHSFECKEVSYTTSAEASGDLSRVVGYAGMLLTEVGE